MHARFTRQKNCPIQAAMRALTGRTSGKDNNSNN